MTRKQIGLVLIFLLALFSGVWVAHAQSGEVLVLEIEGPVTPAMESYFQRGIAAGEAEGATAVLIILNTPGGAVDTTTDIIQLFRNANVPIIVFITPSGAQAASAGSICTAAGEDNHNFKIDFFFYFEKNGEGPGK